MLRLQEEMATGRTLVEICDSSNEFPDPATIYLWIEDPELYEIFWRAQEKWCLAQNDIIQKIADDDSRDILTVEDTVITKSGHAIKTKKVTSDNTPVNRARVRILARQWAMAKLAPKIFGERQAIEHSGTINVQPTIELSLKAK